MDGLDLDRRRVRPVREGDWKRLTNAEQAETLRTLEQIGWSIRFVRRSPEGGPLAAVYNPDSKSLAIIEADGRLVEKPTLAFRA
jgi:hypothetical protein